MRRARRIAKLVSLAAGAALIMSACTGGGSDPSPTTVDAGPPITDADSVIRPIDCTPPPSPHSVDGWLYTAYASKASGLVVKGLRFGPRLVAGEMSIPYIRPVEFAPGVGHLSVDPLPGDGNLTSSLVDGPECNPDGHPGVGATYEVKSARPALTFVVHQSYRFDEYDDATRCEASKTVHCVRFWPTVTWGLLGTGAAAGQGEQADWGLRIVQRFQFDPDGMGADAADVTRDTLVLHTGSIEDLAGHGMLTKEGAVLALTNGKIKKWENWHQTFRPMIGLPGLPAPVGGSGYAGCSECVHAHWSWFGGRDTWISPTHMGQQLACGQPKCWTDGHPQILPGSLQTACAGWVRASTVATSTDWCARVGHDGASIDPPTPLAFYWDAYTAEKNTPRSGVDIKGYGHLLGDSYWPQLPAGNSSNGVDGSLLGDTGAMFIVPARRIVAVSQPPLNAGEALVSPGPAYRNDVAGSRVPAGYVVPVDISFAPGVDDKGPYYLRVHADGLTVQNPAPGYAAANTGEPWVDVYDDPAAPGTAQLDVDADTQRLPGHKVPAGLAPDPSPMHAFVVFDRMPTASNHIAYELDAAPDGVAYLVAGGYAGTTAWPVSTGRWGGSSPEDHSPAPPPDNEYTVSMQAGWQYQLRDNSGFTLASTGGGVAGDVHIDATSQGLYKDISAGYLLAPGQAGSPSLCSALLLDKSEYWATWGPSAPNPLPWSVLKTGTQACVDDGVNWEVLTVTSPWDGTTVVFDVKVWRCVVPAGESVC